MTTAATFLNAGDARAQVWARVDGGVAWLELHNPAKLNAMTLGMWQELVNRLAEFEKDPQVRCVVIAGQGDKAFCAGADIDEKSASDGDAGDAYNRLVIEALKTIEAFPKPTVAMIAGHCLGGGVALAIACDLRVASVDSRFAIPAARLGLACFYSMVERLGHLVGPSAAKHMLFTAGRYSAQDALRFGLVDEVVGAAELRERVHALSAGIASNAPLSIAAAKRAVETVFSGAAAPDLAACDALERACAVSHDYLEGRLAFTEKRAPVFRGR